MWVVSVNVRRPTVSLGKLYGCRIRQYRGVPLFSTLVT